MVDTQVHPLEGKERNAYSSGRVKETRVKETTFREWVVANQIGILPVPLPNDVVAPSLTVQWLQVSP